MIDLDTNEEATPAPAARRTLPSFSQSAGLALVIAVIGALLWLVAQPIMASPAAPVGPTLPVSWNTETCVVHYWDTGTRQWHCVPPERVGVPVN